MNAELVKKALEKVLNPNVLVNLVSQRVRQLTNGGGGISRPLIRDVGNLGAADIALREIIEDKMGFEMPEVIELTRPTGRGRKRPQSWGRHKTGAAGEENGAKDFPARKRALTHG
jgi:DNA-directed RNA polymerase subunit omega